MDPGSDSVFNPQLDYEQPHFSPLPHTPPLPSPSFYPSSSSPAQTQAQVAKYVASSKDFSYLNNRNSDSFDERSSNTTHEDNSVSSMGLVFKVQFKSTTDHFYLGDSCTRDIAIGDYVKVEADRGHDVGMVADIFWPSAEEVQALAATNNKEIISIATEDEYLLSKGKSRDEARALSICRDVVASRNMQINLVDAEYQYDRKKLTFFFTSEGHTDFRELVRELFTIFKTRIWMQKIKPFEAAAFQRSNSPIPRFNGGSNNSSRNNSPKPSRGSPSLSEHSRIGLTNSPNGYHPQGVISDKSSDIYRTNPSFPSKSSSSGSNRLLKQATKQATQVYLSQYSQHPPRGDQYNYHQYLRQREVHQHEQLQQYPPSYGPDTKSSKTQPPQLQFHQLQDPFQHQQPPNPNVPLSNESHQYDSQQYTSFSSYVARMSNGVPPHMSPYVGQDFGYLMQGDTDNGNTYSRDRSGSNGSAGYLSESSGH